MSRNVYNLLVWLLLLTLFTACEKPVEEPALDFQLKTRNLGSAHAKLIVTSAEDLGRFDKAGFLVGKDQNLTLTNAQQLYLTKGKDKEYFATVPDLEADQQYFYSLFTKKGETLKIYEARSFTTPRPKTWVLRAPIPQTGGTKYFTAGNKIYVGFGNLRDLYEYDAEHDQWSKKGSLPDQIRSKTILEIQDLGNGKALAYALDFHAQTNIAQLYDSKTDSWKEVATISDTTYFDIGARSALIGAVGKAYVVGLEHQKDRVVFMPKHRIYEFDATTERWSIRTEYNGIAYYYPKGFSTDEHIYLLNEMNRKDIRRINLNSGIMINQFATTPVNTTSFLLSIAKWKNGFLVNSTASHNYYYSMDTLDWTELPSSGSNTYENPLVVHDRLFKFNIRDGFMYEFLP
jgi:hypothetical protein